VSKSDKKGLSTIVTQEDYELIRQIAEAQGVTISMLVKRAVTDYCQRMGYEDVDLAGDVGDWGGKRKGSGRPAVQEDE
jgi:hypothetical protein